MELPGTEKYTYHKHETITEKLRNQAHLGPRDAPCRFLTSKGRKKRALSPDIVTIPDQGEGYDESSDRIKILYPLGSTYNLRKDYLLPILQDNHQIIVSPETDFYRRMSVVHTQKKDSFVEIGCDFGFTVGIVECDHKLGIDKSTESIGIAHDNYPTCDLLQADLLECSMEEMQAILEDKKLRPCEDVEGGLVVAIDIGGNRELEAVVQCLDRVLNWWNPRLVIVKSRELYSLMLKQNM